MLEPNGAVGPDAFNIDFAAADTIAAQRFSFAIDSTSGQCVLTAVGVEGAETYVSDASGGFADFHYVYILDPTVTDTMVTCGIDESNVLSCSVLDQDVLQLFDGLLTISAVAESGQGVTQPTFTVVQVGP
jgi:hypothetical protein